MIGWREEALREYLLQVDRQESVHVVNDEQAVRAGKVIAFWGGGKDGGVTTTLFHTARKLAEKAGKEQQVLCLDLNLKQPELVDFVMPRNRGGGQGATLNLDALLPIMAKGSLSTSELKSRLVRDKDVSNLWFLLGTNYSYLYAYFAGVHFDAILGVCRKVFDYTFVDIGSVVDAAAISALKNCDEVMLPMTHDISAMYAWKMWTENLLSGFNLRKKSKLVIVKKHNASDLEATDMEDFLSMPALAKLPFVPEAASSKNTFRYIWDVSTGKEAKAYTKEISSLADYLLTGKKSVGVDAARVSGSNRLKEMIRLVINRGSSSPKEVV